MILCLLKTSELLNTELAAVAHMAVGLTWNKGSLEGSERELSTSNAHERWTGFKAHMKYINDKNCFNFVPSVMQSVQIKALMSVSVNIDTIFRARESVAAKSNKLPLHTFKFLSVEVIIIIIIIIKQ